MKFNFIPRGRELLFMLIFFAALASGPGMLNTDSDLGRHLTLGQYILDSHHIPTRDLLSHTKADQSRPPYEWLAQVIFALTYRLLNLDGVVLLTSLIIALTYFIVYHHAVKRSGLPILSLVFTFLAAAASSLHWLTRPHIFTFLFLVFWIEWLENVQIGKSTSLWQFPLLMFIWANTHGGFIFGILAWGAYFAGWLWDYWHNTAIMQIGKTLLFAGITSFLATIITPDLWHNWDAILNNRSAYILSRTSETMPPNLALPTMWPFTATIILTILLSAINWKNNKASQLLLLSGLGMMALLMARNIPLFAIASVPILAGSASKVINRYKNWKKLEERLSSFESKRQIIFWPAIIVLASTMWFAINFITSHKSINQFDPHIFPVRAADWIEANKLQGKMFNDFNWGGYLLYRLWPEQKVFIDSQSDFYGESLTRNYESILAGSRNWDNELKTHNINWMIVPNKSRLANITGSDSNWQVIYKDDLTIIFSRK